MPEIKYRRILCDAFGPGGWGIVPTADPVIGDRTVTREYALMVSGRYALLLPPLLDCHLLF